MQANSDSFELINDIFSTEREGVRIAPGPEKGQIIVDYIEDHHIHGAIFEPTSYFDFISFGALKFLYKRSGNLEQENLELKEKVARLERQIFGTSSEQLPVAEADLPAQPAESGPETAAPNVEQMQKPRTSAGGRKPLPAHLPRERITYEIPAHERFCPCCQGMIHPIDVEVTEQLTVIPAKFKVVQHARQKYVCRHCDKFVVAPGPKHLIEKSSYASPDFLAHVACSKYQYGLPFYRQEAIFEQSGIPINRTTLANLMVGCTDRLVALHETLRQELLRQDAIHADETTIQVLKEEGRKPQTTSYLWLYRSREDALQPIVLFEYTPTRAGIHPQRFLDADGKQPFTGFLQVDGYKGYNGLSGVTRVGCMVHVRRKFVDAIKVLPSQAAGSPAQFAVELIGKLYDIERRIKGLPHRIRYKVRQEESVPLLREFKAWLDEMQPKVTPKGGLGAAIRYALEQWPAVSRYVDDGRLSIDNNIAERDIKAVVIGRKNWLFADSVDGAHANAIMYSLVQTAKANAIDPFTYLRYVIGKMPTLSTANDMQALLPWNMPHLSSENCLMAA